MGWYEKLFGKSNTPAVIEAIPDQSLAEMLPQTLFNSSATFVTPFLTIPGSLRNLWVNPSSQAIVKSTWDNLKDIAPWFLVDTAVNLLRTSLDLNREAPLLSIDGSLLMALELVNIGVNIYTAHAFFKSTITTLCAPAAFYQSDITPSKPSLICKPECKGTLVLLNGAMNETATYYSNLAALWALGKVPMEKIPYLGWLLSNGTAAYVSGRYIAGLTAQRCREHEYLKFEPALSLGIIHKGLEYCLWLALNSSSGTPSFAIMRVLNDIPLLLTIAITTSQVNASLVTTTRPCYDPLEFYENVTRFIFEGASAGAKVQIKKMLQGPPSTIPWAKIGNQALTLTQHPYVYSTGTFLLPKMLHSWDYFINEPMISPRWSTIQKQVVTILMTLEEASHTTVVNIANKAPDKAARLLQYFFGFPKPVTKILLDIMSNNTYMQIVETLRRWFQVHMVKKDTGIALLTDVIALRTLEDKPKLALAFEENNKSEAIAGTNVIAITPDPNKFFSSKKAKPLVSDVSKYMLRK